ncbi:MAG: hypothetical protein ABIP24_00805 [Croceibacterium sp.]
MYVVNDPIAVSAMSDNERWALVMECRATFGSWAAAQLAERLGVVTKSDRPVHGVDF